ncbi:MAG: hypothetical protein ACOC3Z_02615, partial [Nanoarchaeota archaeon]
SEEKLLKQFEEISELIKSGKGETPGMYGVKLDIIFEDNPYYGKRKEEIEYEKTHKKNVQDEEEEEDENEKDFIDDDVDFSELDI